MKTDGAALVLVVGLLIPAIVLALAALVYLFTRTSWWQRRVQEQRRDEAMRWIEAQRRAPRPGRDL